ncbi:excalibur calcium-binding domain-containing protein [Streptomyces sp. NPDC051320]|uniref:excalibur calcium-binding domain-containing protein n=1 Tax=Streptomyces sp. NPDC051320 TaxID=3154644 RepID=UPI00342D38B3
MVLVTALAGCNDGRGDTDSAPAAVRTTESPSASPSQKPELKLSEDAADADAGKQVLVDVLANDVVTDAAGVETAIDGQSPGTQLTVDTAPNHGTTTVDGTSVAYTATAGYAGNDQFTYRVETGDLSGTATVWITVATPAPKVTVKPKPKHAPKPKAKATPKATSATVYYRNCAAVRAAGAAPIRRGQPGYAPHLDADGDGIGCEPYSGGGSSGGSSGESTGGSSGGSSSSGGSGSTYYQNCDAVRAAGAAPIHVGDPGYARHLDRDGDGVGCE